MHAEQRAELQRAIRAVKYIILQKYSMKIRKYNVLVQKFSELINDKLLNLADIVQDIPVANRAFNCNVLDNLTV